MYSKYYMWVDKYLPKTFSDLYVDDNIKQLISNKNIFNMIFYGAPGTGKCLGFDTKIRMYNNSFKSVQNIHIYDIIRGDDIFPRIVINTISAYGHLYKIINCDNNTYYIVNDTHILTIFWFGKVIDMYLSDLLYIQNILGIKLCGVKYLLGKYYLYNIYIVYFTYGQYYGFELLSITNKRFIINDNIVTHNTSSSHIIGKFILGDKFSDAFMELNASDDRCYDVLYDKIGKFIDKKTDCDKIILLDESDQLSNKSQQLILDYIYKNNNYKYTCYFILTCNDLTNLINEFKSLFITINFKKISNDLISNNLIRILDNENICYDNEAINTLSLISNGDMRYAINNLEAICSIIDDNFIHIEDIYKICNIPPTNIIKDVLLHLNFATLFESGYSVSDIFEQLVAYFKINEVIDKINIIDYNEIIKIITYYSIIIVEKLDTKLQLVCCIIKINKILKKYHNVL